MSSSSTIRTKGNPQQPAVATPSSSPSSPAVDPTVALTQTHNLVNGQPLSVRQQLRQRRELEELRKFGLAPLARDVVSGQEISPNIPLGLTQAPWFYGVQGPTLEHHRIKDPDGMKQKTFQDAIDRVEEAGKQEKYLPGACENCGAMSHKSRDCLLPRRKVTAAHSGVVEGVDLKVVQNVEKKTFSQKRDKWAGATGDDIWEDFAKREREGAELRGPPVPHAKRRTEEKAEDPSELSQLFQASAGNAQSTEIKSLPRYLENMDAGAFYDPVTRSMRGNPHEAKGSIDSAFQGENARLRGDDYRNALELQARFLQGASECMVDMEADTQMQLRKKQQHDQAHAAVEPGKVVDHSPVNEEENHLLEVLYQATASTSSDSKSKHHPTSHNSKRESTLDMHAAANERVETREEGSSQPHSTTPNGDHSRCYGSYFDPKTLQWGYGCCHQTKQDVKCTAFAQPS